MSSEETIVTERLSNNRVGQLIELSHVQVHRIRRGERLPSIPTMTRIERVFDWKVADQVKARETPGKYASEFDEVIARYAATLNTATGPEE